MSNSHSTSETETAGNAVFAKNNINRQHKAYKILIFGDERERTLALTRLIAMPSVLVVINTSEETAVKNTSILRKSNSVKKAIGTSRYERSPIKRKTIN